jgi:hypothetical protein
LETSIWSGRDGPEQRLQVAAGALPLVEFGEVGEGVSVAGGGVDDGEVELPVVGAQLHVQLEDMVVHLRRARIGAVDLVDDHDRDEAHRQGLAQHEPRLRHRAVVRVDEQQHAVDHLEDALDLAAEIGVAGRVDDVDAEVAVLDGGVLREDRDPALAFEVVRVHDAFGDLLVRAEGAALAQHGVDQRGLAMVDVGDDGDVAEVLDAFLGHRAISSLFRVPGG